MILQTTFTNGSKGFTDIGKDFSLVEKEVSPDEFAEAVNKIMGGSGLEKECYAVIFYENGKENMPLYKGFDNCLYNELGGKFKDLTFR